MAPPKTPLGKAVQFLKDRQDAGVRVFHTDDLPRREREILVENKFLMEVIKGWYVATSPYVAPGDTSPWSMAIWEFTAKYLNSRFGTDWCLGPNLSAELQTGSSTLPKQIYALSSEGDRNVRELIDGYSIFVAETRQMPQAEEIIDFQGLRVLKLPSALIRLTPAYFKRDSQTKNTFLLTANACANLRELPLLLMERNQPVVAGRIIGVLRELGREREATNLERILASYGQKPVIENPFDEPFEKVPLLPLSPYVARMKLQWHTMLKQLEELDKADVRVNDIDGYMERVDGAHILDAYHSLSIEGYKVTEEMIRRIEEGEWNPEEDPADKQSKDALAALGYHEAFQFVKAGIRDILHGTPASEVVRSSFDEWYRQLFGPSVRNGILRKEALLGYRSGAIYIRGSQHVPPSREAALDMLDVLFGELLSEDISGFAKAVLAHYFFVYIHPFPDGNGRVSRFLMNTFLASGGHEWLVIRKEDRDSYFEALEQSRIVEDIRPFARFVRSRIEMGPKVADKPEERPIAGVKP